jgi:oligoendopeptidase F
MLINWSTAAAETPTREVPDRDTIDAKYKWDLALMYASESDWDTHYAEVESMVDRLQGMQGQLGSAPEFLAQALDLRDRADVQIEKLYAFAMMWMDEDMRAAGPQSMKKRAQTLAVRYGESCAWLAPELLQIPRATLEGWLQREDLAVYAHFFDDLWRSQAHVLSPREEELLAMASKANSAATEAFGLLTNAELKLRTMTDRNGDSVEISPGVYHQMLYSKDRNERRDAYLGHMASYIEIKNTLAATLGGAVERDWFGAKARHYDSCLEASLDAENLPVSVYHNLIDTVGEHLPLLHRHTELKKRKLGLDEMHPYDLYVSLIDMPERKYTYEEGCALVLEGVAPLGPEYCAMMEKSMTSHWIDVHENKGKRSGAYNMGTYLSPPYVLLNFNGTYNDVSTIAHELGHAMQSYYSQQNQPAVYSGYPMFTAEVASTAAEIILKQHMLNKTTDTQERAWMIETMLENIRTTVFRQTKFSEFDLAVHGMAEQGEALTADAMMAKGRAIFEKYYGPTLVLDEESDIEPLRIPHYYRNFYVYRYATSYSAATALAKRIIDAEPGAVDDFMKFLTIGNSMYAIDMLKVAGVDMSTPKPVADCMVVFEDLLDQFEELL